MRTTLLAVECRLAALRLFRLREAFNAAFCRFDPKMAICFALIFRFLRRFRLRAGLTSVRFL